MCCFPKKPRFAFAALLAALLLPSVLSAQVSLHVSDDDLLSDESAMIHVSDAVLQETLPSIDWTPTPCSQSSNEPQTWIRAEYLNWWIKGNDLPPLLTTSPAGTPRLQAGVLPAATVLLGSESIDDGERPGVRVTLGQWFGDDGELGVEASWASVFDDTSSGDYDFESPGLPILARPYFDASTGLNASGLIAYTDPANVTIAEGSFQVRSSSEMHLGGLSLRRLYREGPRGRIDLVGGYRYFRFREGLLLQEQMIARDPGGLAPVGTVFDLTDNFVTENSFHGGEVGFVAEFYRDGMSLEVLAKVALGNVERSTTISGNTVITPPPLAGPAISSAGGLLTQPTNIGIHREDQFAALPEFGFNVKLPVTHRATFTAGYTLLMLNGVARTGGQIDTAVNSTQLSGGTLVGPPRPLPQLAESDFWAQGLQVGLVIER